MDSSITISEEEKVGIKGAPMIPGLLLGENLA